MMTPERIRVARRHLASLTWRHGSVADPQLEKMMVALLSLSDADFELALSVVRRLAAASSPRRAGMEIAHG